MDDTPQSAGSAPAQGGEERTINLVNKRWLAETKQRARSAPAHGGEERTINTVYNIELSLPTTYVL